MKQNRKPIALLHQSLPSETKETLARAVASIVSAKKKGGKVVVVTGSGPNLHEGVTTLIAELIDKGIIDGVTTSSAVIAHEMGGVLDKVKRVDGKKLGFSLDILPRGDIFEITIMPDALLEELKKEMIIDSDLMQRGLALDGDVIIKAAGNMGYPLGLRTERLARELMSMAHSEGLPLEVVAGRGADPRTMLGAAYKKGVPCLVTVPQLIGGGAVGIAVADSISIARRTALIGDMLAGADVIIESAVALTQEIHDGPFETYTGHGIWADWEGYRTFSLRNKTLIRLDLDPNLKRAWEFERQSSEVQKAIDKGLPKTKLMDIPFRMEMSGFARLENSIPLIGDIGVLWPVMAYRIEQEMDIELDFMSCPQQTDEGKKMREWIVENIRPARKMKSE
ncbi:MAG: hypothetical protein GXO75_11150 [Calditrichaeota bacterium]|nr:hypothetical protein [Calditrichota bacterium]